MKDLFARLPMLAVIVAFGLWSVNGHAQRAADDVIPTDTGSDQATEADADEVFVDTLDVNVVNVDVYVTDKQGNRITDLERDDFELLVDKKPMVITNFYAVTDGQPARETLEEIERPQTDVPELPEATTTPDDQRLHLIVYVDNFNLKPFSRNNVIRATRTFLRSRMRTGDQVMLVSYDRSLKIRHPFTTDPELVANALYELEDLSAHRIHQDSDRQDLIELIYEDADELYDVRGRAVQYAESLYNDLAFTLDALRDQVELLAGLPGRKAILYVSEGLAMRAGEDIFYALSEKFVDSSVLMDSQRFDMSRRFQALTAQANTNRVTFYTIDAAGLRTYSYLDASNSIAGGGSQIDQIRFTNLQSPLLFMAEQTGGFAVINHNRFDEPLGRMADDFGTYYSLGFMPADTEGGRYHRIQVKLTGEKRRGISIRHREGYRAKGVGARMTDSALAALHFGYQKNVLGIELAAGASTRQDDGFHLVPLTVKIPIGKLTFLPQDEMQRGRVKLYIAAKDADGGMAPVQEVPLPIDIPTGEFERAKEQFYHYNLTLMMREGRQMVTVGVRDEIGATTGFTTRGMTIGS